jgi:YbbR domain-containing protein
MSRVVAFLFRNWPLKLAALVLATMLYAGLVLSQSVQELAGGVTIDPVNIPEDETVAIRGPASVIERVVEVRADIVIEPNGLDIDREVELIPVDAVGDRVTPVDVEPATAHIRIEIFSDLQTRPLPITPVLGGDPAPGYEIADIDVEPLIASVEGDADQLIGMARVDTAPVQISGATATVTATVPLALPDGVLAIPGSETATVTVTIRPIAATRAYEAGIELDGQRAGLAYDLSTINARATLGGSLGDLEALDAAAFVLSANVASLGPGTHDVTLTADLPAGLSLVTVDPAVITVTITAAAASPGASPGASP